MKLPLTFDIDYFCKAAEVILDSEHHQLIGKLLALIYNYADIFEGQARRILFGDLLLKQEFYHLFLNWDDNVRNSFQQILVFKMIRLKRSELHKAGVLLVKELAMLDEAPNMGGGSKRGSLGRSVAPVTDTFSDFQHPPPSDNINIPSSNGANNTSTTSPSTNNNNAATNHHDAQGNGSNSNNSGTVRDWNSNRRVFGDQEEHYTDAVLYSKIESFVHFTQEQMRNPARTYYAKPLEVYVPRALSEYKMYLSRYYSWERSGETEPPKLVSMALLQTGSLRKDIID